MTASREAVGARLPIQRPAPGIQAVGAVLLDLPHFEAAAQELGQDSRVPTRIWGAIVSHHVLVTAPRPPVDPNQGHIATERARKNEIELRKPWPIVFETVPDLSDGRRHGAEEFSGLHAVTLAKYAAMLRRYMGPDPSEGHVLRVLRGYAARDIGLAGLTLIEHVVKTNLPESPRV